MSFYDNISNYKENIAAITDAGELISYDEISSFSDEFYSCIGHRCLVFILCENSPGSLCGYVSCLNKRIVPFLIDKDLEGKLLLSLIQTYLPEYLWIPQAQTDTLVSALNDFSMNEVFCGFGYVLYKTGVKNPYELFPELALLLTTSGSTGSPKLVRISYSNLDSNTEAIIKYLGISKNDSPITTLPMNYTYGLSIINSHLSVGAKILLTNKTLMQKEFWQFFREQSATTFGGVPYTYEMLKKLRFFNMNLPSLRTITQAGGKLSGELTREYAEYCQTKGLKFFVMYGQTEATARMSYLSHEFAVSKCGSMGIAIPGGEFNLIDENGNTINEPDAIGELVYKGPNVTLGYAECGEDLQKGDERHGVLYTGDMAKRDSDGFYYITGRKKRFIKLFGNRINLDEAEQLIKSIISDCACTGQDDHMKIYITEVEKKDAVLKFISEKTGINLLGFEVILIDEIPKNEAGKKVYTNL